MPDLPVFSRISGSVFIAFRFPAFTTGCSNYKHNCHYVQRGKMPPRPRTRRHKACRGALRRANRVKRKAPDQGFHWNRACRGKTASDPLWWSTAGLDLHHEIRRKLKVSRRNHPPRHCRPATISGCAKPMAALCRWSRANRNDRPPGDEPGGKRAIGRRSPAWCRTAPR